MSIVADPGTPPKRGGKLPRPYFVYEGEEWGNVAIVTHAAGGPRFGRPVGVLSAAIAARVPDMQSALIASRTALRAYRGDSRVDQALALVDEALNCARHER